MLRKNKQATYSKTYNNGDRVNCNVRNQTSNGNMVSTTCRIVYTFLNGEIREKKYHTPDLLINKELFLGNCFEKFIDAL